MGPADTISLHFETGCQIGFAVVVSLAGCVAAWRIVRDVLRRRQAEAQARAQRDDSNP